VIATALAYAQVVLGTGVRHTEQTFLPYLITHICVGLSLFGVAVWFAMRTYQVYRDVAPLRRAALFVAWFMVIQMSLGVASIYANVARREPEMAIPHHVAESTAHLAGGASILAVLFVTTLRAYRKLSIDPDEKVTGQQASLDAAEAVV
jgi:heme A synthase